MVRVLSLGMRISYFLLGAIVFLLLAVAGTFTFLLHVAPGSLDARLAPSKSSAQPR
jgi:hypothetical protein